MKDPALAWAGFIGLFFLAIYVDNIHIRWRQTRDRNRSRSLSGRTGDRLRSWRRPNRVVDRLDRETWAFLAFALVCCVVGVWIRLASL